MKIRKIIKPSRKSFTVCFITLIIVFGVFIRFYNLNWGAPFFFHPDERNIAGSISQLVFPNQMNPHFFAYGTLPIYTVFFLGLLQNLGTIIFHQVKTPILQVGFENAIIIGRIFSAILSVGVLFFIYKMGRLIGNKSGAAIGLCLATLSVGYIQYAHFSTFEMWLSFLTLLLTYSLLHYFQSRKVVHLILIGIELGILTSVKISSLIFLPLALFIVLSADFLYRKKSTHVTFLRIEKVFLKILIIIGISLTTVFITSPFFWFDNNSLRSSLTYEVNVATGKLPVFYTQGFMHSVPIVQQLFTVYPFLLNPFIEAAFFLSLPYILYCMLKRKSSPLFIIFLMFFAAFFSQAFLYAKWTRYYIPTIGFVYILLGYSLSLLLSSKKNLHKQFGLISLVVLVSSSFIYSYAYAVTVLAPNDSRVEASIWAKNHINTQAKILSEVYDLGIIPFNPYFPSITLFNFYDLDSNPSLKTDLQDKLSNTDYVILPSQRILRTRIESPKQFPLGFKFYNGLMNQRGYKKIYETPCDFMCNILYFGDPIFHVEETANVFDRPTIMIFKKI